MANCESGWVCTEIATTLIKDEGGREKKLCAEHLKTYPFLAYVTQTPIPPK
jgi:ABC-type proline/glycine betaine transport system substrate-binding protein